jgi:Zn-dependent M28 family amino/carboxypeptidase
MNKFLLFAVSLILALPTLAQDSAQRHFDGNSWWEHVKFLADDKLEGRETGSEGLRQAEAYVVDQLRKAGLRPAGTDGYYQAVKFQSRQIIEKDSSATLIRNGKAEPLVLGDDTYFNTRVDLAPTVEAPLVFVGYGLSIPEKNYDDFAGLDLKGKVAVLLTGSPKEIPGALASHYQSSRQRWQALQKAGAIGMIGIPNPAAMDIPWSRISLNRAHPNMGLAGAQFDETAGEQLSLTFNPERAEKLFAGSGHTFAEIAELGKNRQPLPHFPLAASIKAVAKMEKTEVVSANVVAALPGSDPKLKNEYVALSAHVDHVGIGEAVDGDRIYNGAMDNASGASVLLDVAASLQRSKEKMKRSVLFVFVTGEEKGLLGSKYFTANPTVNLNSMIADINIDMFLPIIPLKVLTVYGLAESDLGERAREVALAQGIAVQPDPEPLRNSFIRSDQYNFILHGIPSLIMSVGTEPDSPEQKIFKDWLTQRYHAPADDLNQPVDLQAAAKYEEIVRSLLINVANDDGRPKWKQDSFFRRYAQEN